MGGCLTVLRVLPAQSSLSDAQKLLQQQGLDTKAVAGASRSASTQASDIFSQVRYRLPLRGSPLARVTRCVSPVEHLSFVISRLQI